MKFYPCRVLCDSHLLTSTYVTGCKIIVSHSEVLIKFPLWFHSPVKMLFGNFTYRQENDKQVVLVFGQQHFTVYMARRKMRRLLELLRNKYHS